MDFTSKKISFLRMDLHAAQADAFRDLGNERAREKAATLAKELAEWEYFQEMTPKGGIRRGGR